MKFKIQNSKFKTTGKNSKLLTFKPWFLLFTFYFLLFTLCGCESFVRKFTRKSKKEKAPEEMVLSPEEWKGPQMTKEQQYRQYLLFWQSWQDELITSLIQNSSNKKKNDCIEQAMNKLLNMSGLLKETKQRQLDIYLSQMNDLKKSIKADIYGVSSNSIRQDAERTRRDILQYFSYNDIKNDLR